MSRQTFKIIFLFLSTCLMAACAIMPSAQPPKLQMLHAEPAGYQPHVPDPSVTPLPPTKYTFPSTVKTSALAEGSADEIAQLKALLPDTFKVSQANAQTHVAEFKSKKANGKSQILIPENGSFDLVLESGSQYAIVDDNATNGQAKITIPAGSLESWVHLQGPWSADSALALEDGLYYVKDKLNNKQGNVACSQLKVQKCLKRFHAGQ